MPWVFSDVREEGGCYEWKAIDCEVLNDATLEAHWKHYCMDEHNSEAMDNSTFVGSWDDVISYEQDRRNTAIQKMNRAVSEIRKDPKICLQPDEETEHSTSNRWIIPN